jgi:hypothetical protein
MNFASFLIIFLAFVSVKTKSERWVSSDNSLKFLWFHHINVHRIEVEDWKAEGLPEGWTKYSITEQEAAWWKSVLTFSPGVHDDDENIPFCYPTQKNRCELFVRGNENVQITIGPTIIRKVTITYPKIGNTISISFALCILHCEF